MPTTPTSKTSPAALVTRLGLAVALALGFSLTLSPSAPEAALIDSTAAIDVRIVEREGGNDQGVHALVYLESRYLVPIEGDVTLTVNGVIRKVQPTGTNSKTMLDIPLGPMTRPITACANFGGVIFLGGDNYRSTQASNCDHLPLIAPPGFRGDLQPPPRLGGRLPSPSRLR